MTDSFIQDIYGRAMEKLGMRKNMKIWNSLSRDAQNKIIKSMKPGEVRGLPMNRDNYIGSGFEADVYKAIMGGTGAQLNDQMNGYNAVIKRYKNDAGQKYKKNREDIKANPDNASIMARAKKINDNYEAMERVRDVNPTEEQLQDFYNRLKNIDPEYKGGYDILRWVNPPVMTGDSGTKYNINDWKAELPDIARGKSGLSNIGLNSEGKLVFYDMSPLERAAGGGNKGGVMMFHL